MECVLLVLEPEPICSSILYFSKEDVDSNHSDSEGNETAQEKRLRIAKEYINKLEQEGKFVNCVM